MGMPITKIGSLSTGHGCYPPQTLVGGSSNVFTNGIPTGRLMDPYTPHCCYSECHGGNAAQGSGSVFVNGLPVHRIGDAVSCGGSAMTGSFNVFAGG